MKMNFEGLPATAHSIESPGVILAKARVADLVKRAHVDVNEAMKVIDELEEEITRMQMPKRFRKREKPLGNQYDIAAPMVDLSRLTADEQKCLQLHTDLRLVKNAIIQAASHGGDYASAVNRLEFVIMDIESTKTEEYDPKLPEKTMTVQLQGIDIKLDKIGPVFNPSPHGLFLGENIRVNPGESVIDVGTGSGLFAIMADRLGGKVAATEITREAVEMTKFNAILNGASVDVRKGSFFASFKDKFDVLIANLPQKLILDPNAGKESSAKHLGVHGGSSGNELLLTFLAEAKDHMHPKSRLYIQVYSLTDYQTTLREISKNYAAKPLAKREFIEDELIGSNVEAYEALNRQGVVDITHRDGHWYTHETAYELTLLPAPSI